MWGPLVLLDEGHVGVALFMTLSGYLFAKLLDGKSIIFPLFLYNRALRLFPLLLLVFFIHIIIEVIRAQDIHAIYRVIFNLFRGFVFPVWPNGGWSVAVELQFYLILPFLLMLRQRNAKLLVALLLVTLFSRYVLFLERGQVQDLSYWTLVGRIDQFVLGILAFHYRNKIQGNHYLAITVAASLISLYYWFNMRGGFYLTDGKYPSPSTIWIWLPTAEGLAFGVLIVWYETCFSASKGAWSRWLSKVGEYSYSIYLWHFFYVFELARFINDHVFLMSTYTRAFMASLVGFALMIPIGYLSMKYIEAPFLRHRRPYYRS